jgi:PKD repeat protein
VQPEYTYPEKGEYAVSLAATNKTIACSDTLIKENYIFCSGVGIADEGKDGFNYYIDQSGTTLHLNFGNQPKNLLFSLYDMLGIMQKTTVLFEKNSTVSLNGLAPGMYFFVIDNKITGKILIH